MILNNLLWIKNPINIREIKKSLTVVAKAYTTKGEVIRLYEEKNGFIGVPRVWGLKKFGNDFKDDTVFPYKEWPKSIFKFWSGQKEVVENICFSFLKNNELGLLLEALPGSGKTVCSLAIASKLDTSVLVLVHKEDLLRQWKKRIKEFFPSCKIGHIQREKKVYKNKHVTVATAQTLYIRRKEFDEDFFRSFGLIIIDEVHRFAARTYCYVLKSFHARYRLGVSATLRRADKLECVWYWHVGNKKYVLKTKKLIGTYQAVRWRTNYRDSYFKSFDGEINHTAFITVISKDVKYNKWLAEQAVIAAKAGRKVLIVSDRINQLVLLKNEIMKDGKISVGLFVGSFLNDEGKKKLLTESELDEALSCQIILATYGKIAEGTDCPELDTLFLATPRVEVEQVVGRILRFHVEKKQVLIVDPVFQTPYMRVLAKKRIETYKRLNFIERSSEKG